MTRDNGGAAFPSTYKEFDIDIERWRTASDMTLRDYFAAKAIPAALAMAEKCYRDSPEPQTIANWSYELADAMLKARSA